MLVWYSRHHVCAYHVYVITRKEEGLGTIHLGRRQIFTILNPTPSRRQFSTTIRLQIWPIFDPSPHPEKCRRLKRMVPYCNVICIALLFAAQNLSKHGERCSKVS